MLKILKILCTGLFLNFAFSADPVLDPIGNISFDEDDDITISVSASDADEDPLTFGCDPGTNINCSVDQGNDEITFSSINLDWNGSEDFSITVSDGTGGTDSEIITVTVDPVNDDPVLDSIGDISFDEEDSITIDVSAEDIDSDPSGFILVCIPTLGEGANIACSVNPGNDQITFSALDSDWSGSETCLIGLNDGGGGTEREHPISCTPSTITNRNNITPKTLQALLSKSVITTPIILI